MILLLFILAVIGLTNILVHGVILDDEFLGLRTWLKAKLGKYGKMLECYECAGFWAGLVLGFVLLSWNPLITVPAAFAGAGIMHLYINVIDWLTGPPPPAPSPSPSANGIYRSDA